MDFPELTDQGKEEAAKVLKGLEESFYKAAENAISKLYCDYLPHIETDAWQNYRNAVERQLGSEIQKHLTSTATWAVNMRKIIYEQHRDELEKGIIADLERRIEELENDVKEAWAAAWR